MANEYAGVHKNTAIKASYRIQIVEPSGTLHTFRPTKVSVDATEANLAEVSLGDLTFNKHYFMTTLNSPDITITLPTSDSPAVKWIHQWMHDFCVTHTNMDRPTVYIQVRDETKRKDMREWKFTYATPSQSMPAIDVEGSSTDAHTDEIKLKTHEAFLLEVNGEVIAES